MAVLGFFYVLLMFLCCFAAVHFIKLAIVGFKSVKRKPEPKPEPKKEEPQKPIYYIVEKKRARRSYSAPKEIEFKDK